MIFVKRPLTVSGFAFGAGAFAASLFNIKITLFLCALCATAFVLTLAVSRLRKAVLSVSLIFLAVGMLLSGIKLYGFQDISQTLMQNPQVKNAVFTAQERLGATRTTGQLELDNGQKVTVLLSGTKTEPHKVYTVSGTFEEISREYKNHCYSDGAMLELAADEITDTGKSGGSLLFSTAYKIRDACSDKLYACLPQKEASVIDALLLGNKSSLDSSLKSAFSTSGAAHIAVVSGMHLAVISTFAYSLLHFFTGKRRFSGIVSIAAVICFMLITGFTLSVIRAGIMCIVMLSGSLFSRRGDSLNSLGFAVLLITFINPLSVLDVGFQLSVFATLGIITLVPYLVHACKRYFKSRLAENLLITPVAMSLSACMATAPIIALNYKYIGIYFILTNLLLTVAVVLLLCFSLLFVIFSFIPLCGFLSSPLGLISGLLAKYISFVVTGISSIPYARVDFELPHIEIIVGVLVCACAIAILIKRTPRRAFVSGVCAILVFSLILSIYSVINADSATLTLISTGKGITATVQKNGESAVISCGGTSGRYKVQQHLTDSGNTNILTVKGGTKESGGLFSAVRSSTLSELYLLQDAPSNKRITSTFDSNASLYCDTTQIRLWDKYTLLLIPIKNSTAAVIELSHGYILILPNPEYADNLPGEYKNPALLITTKPLDNSQLHADNTVIACNKTDDSKYDVQGIFGGDTLSLYQDGKISISFDDKINSIKRGE